MLMNYGEKAKIIAYFDLVLLVLGLIILAIVSIIYSFECSNSNFGIVDPDDLINAATGTTTTTKKPSNLNNGDDDIDDDSDTQLGKERLVFIGFITRFVIASIFQLIMVILLLESVLLQSYQRCWVWLVVNKIFLTLMFVSGFIMLFIDPASALVEVICIIYKFFCLRIVNGFGVELQLQAI